MSGFSLQTELSKMIDALQIDLKKKKLETELRNILTTFQSKSNTKLNAELIKIVEELLKQLKQPGKPLDKKMKTQQKSERRTNIITSMIYPNIIVPDKEELPNFVMDVHSDGYTFLDDLNTVDNLIARLKLASMAKEDDRFKIPKERVYLNSKKTELKRVHEDDDIRKGMAAEKTTK